jgi:hypothetical protein
MLWSCFQGVCLKLSKNIDSKKLSFEIIVYCHASEEPLHLAPIDDALQKPRVCNYSNEFGVFLFLSHGCDKQQQVEARACLHAVQGENKRSAAAKFAQFFFCRAERINNDRLFHSTALAQKNNSLQ